MEGRARAASGKAATASYAAEPVFSISLLLQASSEFCPHPATGVIDPWSQNSGDLGTWQFRKSLFENTLQ